MWGPHRVGRSLGSAYHLLVVKGPRLPPRTFSFIEQYTLSSHHSCGLPQFCCIVVCEGRALWALQQIDFFLGPPDLQNSLVDQPPGCLYKQTITSLVFCAFHERLASAQYAKTCISRIRNLQPSIIVNTTQSRLTLADGEGPSLSKS